jgi:hypothetical protein
MRGRGRRRRGRLRSLCEETGPEGKKNRGEFERDEMLEAPTGGYRHPHD